jgi:hypothetical protein
MEKKRDELTYPCIRKDAAETGITILFFDKETGTVIRTGGPYDGPYGAPYQEGHFATNWTDADDPKEWVTPSEEEILRLLNVRGY